MPQENYKRTRNSDREYCVYGWHMISKRFVYVVGIQRMTASIVQVVDGQGLTERITKEIYLR